MAIRQTELATGQKQAPQAYSTGAVAMYKSTFTIPTGMTVATTDIIEIGVLPADHQIVDAILMTTGAFSTSKATVGIMSGDVGSTDTGRTSGAELFSGLTPAELSRATIDDALLLATSDKNRSIGVKFDVAVTGAGQTVTLQLLYANAQ